MDAAHYSEWLDFSGLYLGNLSHADRYRTYEKKISPEGLNVRIVYDFLDANEPRIDVGNWRNHYVYEMDGSLPYRVDRTALALAAIGAERTAEAVRTSQNTSLLGRLTSATFSRNADFESAMENVDPAALMQELRTSMAAALGAASTAEDPSSSFESDGRWESRDVVVASLAAYAAKHAEALRADIERYGDVRKEPGFDPERRRKELEDQTRREYDRSAQIETAEKLVELMRQFEKAYEKHRASAPRKLLSPRRKLLDARKELAERPPDDLVSEARKRLAETEAFIERYADAIRLKPVEDASILERLSEFGEYEYDVRERLASIQWKAPRGLDAGWKRFSLAIQCPEGDADVLRAALDACERLRHEFDKVQAKLRSKVLKSFGRCDVDELARYDEFERNADGTVPEHEIFRLAGSASFNVDAQKAGRKSEVVVTADFAIERDEEHGLQLPVYPSRSWFGW